MARVLVMALALAAIVWLLAGFRGVLPVVELAMGVVYLLLYGSLGIGAVSLLPQLGTQIIQCVQQAPSYLEEARAWVLAGTASYEAYRLPAAVRDASNTSVMHTTELARKYVTEGPGQRRCSSSRLPGAIHADSDSRPSFF